MTVAGDVVLKAERAAAACCWCTGCWRAAAACCCFIQVCAGGITADDDRPSFLLFSSACMCECVCVRMCVVCLQRSAAVVYASADGVSAAMKHGGAGQLVQYEVPTAAAADGPVGLKAWVAQHKAARPGNEQLQKQVGKGGGGRWGSQSVCVLGTGAGQSAKTRLAMMMFVANTS